MGMQATRPEHEVAYQDIVKLLDKYAGKLGSQEMLAIAANLVGKLMALQDQRVVTANAAIEVVRRNIEIGNQQAIAAVRDHTAGSA